MQLSRYLKIFPAPQQPGYMLLYSTKKASMTLLSEEVFSRIEQGDPPEELVEPLMKLGMLVEDAEGERKEVFNFLRDINRLNPNLRVSVILGMECNFSCPYCYEGSLKGRHAMTDETADQLVAYIKERFTPEKKKLVLDFYGGEPLLYTKRIKYIAERLQPFVENQGAVFQFTLVTNGSLLTAKTAQELAAYGLSAAKVTVDGPAANHNRFRPFKRGQGSFDTIINNIKESCGQIKIGVSGNFTSDNYRTFPALLDHLKDEGITPDKLNQVQFHPVMQVHDAFSHNEFVGGCETINEPWLVEASLALRQQIMANGFKTPKITPAPCMIDIEDAFTVHYDGSIFKCIALIGHDRFRVGDIRQGITDYREIYHLDHWQKEAKCSDCAYLPLCFGGCRYMKYQRDGDMDGVDCQQEYLDQTLETLILQEVSCRRQ